MASSQVVDLRSVIDDKKLGSFQILIISLCALVIAIDGFDTQMIGFVGPALLAEFKAARPALGPVFSAGLVGLMIGSLIISPIADRIGRKPAIMGSVILFGVFSFLCVLSTSLQELTMWRFLTGIGLGGGIPTALTLVGDYAPESRRGSLVMLCSLANPFGSAVGALLAGEMIPIWGWRSVFILGGVLPLVLFGVLFVAMKESPRWLVMRDGRSANLIAIMKRVTPSFSLPDGAAFTVAFEDTKGLPVSKLFTDGRTVATLLLWVIFFMGYLNLFSLSNWLPTMMASVGASPREAVASTALFQIGGFCGGIILSGFVHRRGVKGLALSYLGMALFIILTGLLSTHVYFAMAAVFFAGFFLIASVTGVNGFTATYYPVSIRATGLGWSFGMGRFGSIVGPLVAALLISFQWPNQDVFMSFAVPAAVAAVCLLLIPRPKAVPAVTEPVTA